MDQITEKINNILVDNQLCKEQQEVLSMWYNHNINSNNEARIISKLYSFRDYGKFLKKPYEQATPQDLEAYFNSKKATINIGHKSKTLKQNTLTYYEIRIRGFYRFLKNHTKIVFDEKLCYKPHTIVKKPQLEQEEEFRLKIMAVLQNNVINIRHKKDLKLTPEQLNEKYKSFILSNSNLETLYQYYTYKFTSGEVESNRGFATKIYFIKRLGLFLDKRNKKYKDATRQDIIDYLAEVQQSILIKKAKNTISVTYKSIILDFYRYVYDLSSDKSIPKKYPEVVNWLYQKRKKSHDKISKEIITIEEMKKLINNCVEIRDKAIIALMLDCSCRVGELVNAKISSLKVNEIKIDNAVHNIGTILLRGKTGERTNQLYYSIPHLRLWLMNHPLKDNPNAPLFVATSSNRYGLRLTTAAISSIISRLEKKSGINKHLHAHLFRHTNLTRMAKVFSESELKIHAGWGLDSNMASVYVHLKEEDVANKLLESYGIKPKDEKLEDNILEIRICPNTPCSYQNPQEAQFCLKCGYPLTQETAIALSKIKEKESELLNDISNHSLEGIDIKEANDPKEIYYRILKSDPKLIDKLKEIIELIER